jgi:hypothetical protein
MAGADPLVDEICPAYVGEDRIRVTLGPDETPRAFTPVRILVDYSGCDPDGIVLPVEIFVRAPSRSGCVRRIISSGSPPTDFAWWTPCEGGLHVVLVREIYHCNWWGCLRVNVTGERLRMAAGL